MFRNVGVGQQTFPGSRHFPVPHNGCESLWLAVLICSSVCHKHGLHVVSSCNKPLDLHQDLLQEDNLGAVWCCYRAVVLLMCSARSKLLLTVVPVHYQFPQVSTLAILLDGSRSAGRANYNVEQWCRPSRPISYQTRCCSAVVPLLSPFGMLLTAVFAW